MGCHEQKVDTFHRDDVLTDVGCARTSEALQSGGDLALKRSAELICSGCADPVTVEISYKESGYGFRVRQSEPTLQRCGVQTWV